MRVAIRDLSPGQFVGDRLSELAHEGLLERVPEERLAKSSEYVERLDEELGWLCARPDQCAYFLALGDILAFARRRAIAYMSGWDDHASLVTAFALGHTDIDPVEHGLISARGLPRDGRMPDRQVPVDALRRDEILSYARHRWTDDHIAELASDAGPKRVVAGTFITSDSPVSEAFPIAGRSRRGMHVVHISCTESAPGRFGFLANRLCSVVGRAAESAGVDARAIVFDADTFRFLRGARMWDVMFDRTRRSAQTYAAIQPKTFRDVVAAEALRWPPGTRRRMPPRARAYASNERPRSRHPIIDGETRYTRGFPLYYEQVVAVIRRSTNLSWYDCVTAVRRLNRGDPELRADFLAAAEARLSPDEAREILGWLREVSAAVVVKCSAVGAAMMVCRAAYLAAHFPAAFDAASREFDARWDGPDFEPWDATTPC